MTELNVLRSHTYKSTLAARSIMYSTQKISANTVKTGLRPKRSLHIYT